MVINDNIYTAWWFGTWLLFSISYMGCHPSHWLIFFRGVETTNQYMKTWNAYRPTKDGVGSGWDWQFTNPKRPMRSCVSMGFWTMAFSSVWMAIDYRLPVTLLTSAPRKVPCARCVSGPAHGLLRGWRSNDRDRQAAADVNRVPNHMMGK